MKGDKITISKLINIEQLKNLIDEFDNQQQLSDITGIDRTLINKHYCQRQDISFDSLIRYADAFNVSVDYLLGIEKNEISQEEMKLKICDYTGLDETTVNILSEKGFFGSVLREFVSFFVKQFDNRNNCPILLDFRDLKKNTMTYFEVQNKIKNMDEVSEVIEILQNNDGVFEKINGCKYVLSNFFNSIIDEFALTLCEGLTIQELKELENSNAKKYEVYIGLKELEEKFNINNGDENEKE